MEGSAHIIRGAGAGSSGPVEEITEPCIEVLLEAGDSILYEKDMFHTARGALMDRPRSG